MAPSSDQAAGSAVPASRSGKPVVSNTYLRLAEAAGVVPSVVVRVFGQLRTLIIEALGQAKPFRVHGIVTFALRSCQAKAARTSTIQGNTFTTRPVPAMKRVMCEVATPLRKAVSSSIPYSPAALKPSTQMLCQKIATSIGEVDITTDLVGKVITAFCSAVVLELRAGRSFVVDGIVRFKLVEIKARPAEYVYSTICRRVCLHKAAGPQLRVHGRVLRVVLKTDDYVTRCFKFVQRLFLSSLSGIISAAGRLRYQQTERSEEPSQNMPCSGTTQVQLYGRLPWLQCGCEGRQSRWSFR